MRPHQCLEAGPYIISHWDKQDTPSDQNSQSSLTALMSPYGENNTLNSTNSVLLLLKLMRKVKQSIFHHVRCRKVTQNKWSGKSRGYLLNSCCWQRQCTGGHAECRSSSFPPMQNRLIGLSINTAHVYTRKTLNRHIICFFEPDITTGNVNQGRYRIK